MYNSTHQTNFATQIFIIKQSLMYTTVSESLDGTVCLPACAVSIK